ncbi:MAG: hypothetical protein IKL27_06495 [Oscillospiraceae bacterium]|nr:hypothetical protein [Oscillospiraceae bacterium]
MSKVLDHVEVWKKFQKGLDFNNRIELRSNVETNENFYIGKQWEGVKSNGLPTPVFNFLKQIVQHQVASITSDNIKMNASPLRAAANDTELEKLTQIVNDEFAALFERNKVTTLLREYARNAAVDGSGCLFSYWDGDNDTVCTEILENTRVYFGNPNDKSVQSQPYIIIARRQMLDEVKDYAEEHDCRDVEAIKADTDENGSQMDALVDDKTTTLLYMWKDKETGSVHAIETVKGTVIREEYDMKIRLYPLTWLPWDYVQDCYHGQALITGLIPNQQFVNKAYAMAMVSLMMSAFPKIVYDRNRVTKWTNQVGAQIGVNGDVTNIARVLEPAQISPQVAQFIASAIEHTQSFTGATAAALGNTRPDNTSAIIALQRAASIPSEITKQNLYQSIEDLGRIYMEFMAFYYGKRTVDVPAETILSMDMLQFAGVPQTQTMQVDFDFGMLVKTPMFIKLDVGASAYWSEIASMQTLDNLLQLGQIDIVDYLERIPDGYISKRQELLTKYKAKLSAPPPAPPTAENAEGDVAGMGEEIPVEGGSGNRNLQRAIAQTM